MGQSSFGLVAASEVFLNQRLLSASCPMSLNVAFVSDSRRRPSRPKSGHTFAFQSSPESYRSVTETPVSPR